MIQIISDQGSRRLTYVCEVLFKHILQVNYAILEQTVFESSGMAATSRFPRIYYGIKCHEGICIPDGDLVMENDIRDFTPMVRKSNFIELFPSADTAYTLSFDIFSAIFYLITEYDKWAHPAFDKHGRYYEPDCFTFKNGLHHQPLVNIYANELKKIIHHKYPEFQFPQKKADFEITIDIDHPWAYRHKGVRPWFGIIRDFMRNNHTALRARLNALHNKIDPFDTYNLINQTVPADKLRYFFLIDGDSPYDSKFNWKSRHIRKLINRLMLESAYLGLHPSYFSMDDKQIMRFEKKLLEEITNTEITTSRQHYLRFRYPITYRILLETGITHDYTGCCIYDAGFRYGIVNSFPWFDLEENVMTTLILHPVMAMDVSLKDYLGLSTAEASAKLRELIDITFLYKGVFRLLWHNSSFSEVHGWKGWETVFLDIMDYLSKKS